MTKKMTKEEKGEIWKPLFLDQLKDHFGNVALTVRTHNVAVAKGDTKRMFPKFKQGVAYHAEKDKKFGDAIEKIRAESEPDKIEFAEGALWMGIRKGSVPLIIFALKNLNPAKWQDRSQIGLNVDPKEFMNNTLDNIRAEIKKDRAKK